MFFDNSSIGFGKGRRAGDREDLRMLADVERVWRSQIGGAHVPRRSDINPGNLGDALPHTMILERIAPGIARVRLAGQALNQMFDMDVRGMPASILVEPGSRKALGAQIEAVFAGPAIVEVPLKIARGWGRKPLSARLMMLPMTDGSGRCTRALAVLAVQDGNVSQGHARFEVEHDGAFRCTVLPKPLDRPAPLPSADRRRPLQMPSLTETLPVREPLPLFGIVEGGRRARRDKAQTPEQSAEPRPHLRLVVSNDAPVH